MASFVVRLVCWKCDRSFPTPGDRKNHMANKDHGCMRVLCPFCQKDKFFRRSSPELLEHCAKQHKRGYEAMPSGFFGEANGFWLSRSPNDYIQLVKNPTQRKSSQAEKARELIRKKLEGRRRLETSSREEGSREEET